MADRASASPREDWPTDERKWTRAFNRLEKAVSTHIEQKPAVGFHDEADDALHAAYRSVMKDVGPLC